ncbi:MAG: hypothetical protein HGA90_06415 [Alphaproteobacteria bacterium]|nr:hypothetical protein [Alphaproteobacteria bacterium]
MTITIDPEIYKTISRDKGAHFALLCFLYQIAADSDEDWHYLLVSREIGKVQDEPLVQMSIPDLCIEGKFIKGKKTVTLKKDFSVCGTSEQQLVEDLLSFICDPCSCFDTDIGIPHNLISAELLFKEGRGIKGLSRPMKRIVIEAPQKVELVQEGKGPRMRRSRALRSNGGQSLTNS